MRLASCAPRCVRAGSLLLGMLAVLLASSAAAAPEPRRHFDGPRHLPLAARQDPFLLRKRLYPALKKAGIDRIEVIADGAAVVQQRSPSGMMYLDGVPPPALHGVLLMLPDACRGAEIDLLVEGTGGGDPDRMWSVRRDLSGTISVLQGGPPLALDGPDPTPAELSARFGIGALAESGGATWSADERRALAHALALLSPDELALLSGTRFERARSPKQRHAGLHTPSRIGEPSRIRLFDAAFASAAERTEYVGAPERAVPLPVFVILHQIGHAIANAERRRLLVERQERVDSYERASSGPEQQSRFAALALLDLELEELRTGLGPAERRHAALPGALDGPTAQGRGDAKESFAESFALHHVDPDSLRWIAPATHAWFASAGHLQRAELPAVATPSDPSPSEE